MARTASSKRGANDGAMRAPGSTARVHVATKPSGAEHHETAFSMSHSGPHWDGHDEKQHLSTAWDERGGLALLVLLYMLQGIPLGLTSGAMPFLLSAKLSYTQIGIFSMASYPYSLKLLWSPIVDSCYSRWLGRRKSWILPVQLATAAVMVCMADQIQQLFDAADVPGLTLIFLLLVLLAATQDIAVDGWALELLSPHNVGYASTCQTIGTSTGYFTSFTIFLALLDPKFCNTYLRRGLLGRVLSLWPFNISSEDQPAGLVTLHGYLLFWGWFFVVITVMLLMMRETEQAEDNSVSSSNVEAAEPDGASTPRPTSHLQTVVLAYRQLASVARLPAVWQLAAFLMTYRLGVLAAEGVYNLKLIDKGVPKESLALMVLMQFPVEVVSALVAGRWAANFGPCRPFLVGYFVRLALAAVLVWLTAIFPQASGVTMSSHPQLFTILMVVSLLQSFVSTLCFTSLGSFYNSISDPAMGGSYLTLLNTLANLGYLVPRTPILALMDRLTITACLTPEGQSSLLPRGLACPKKAVDRARADSACAEAGGVCTLLWDGFYWVAGGSVLPGIVLGVVFLVYLPALMSLPLSRWRVAAAGSDDQGPTPPASLMASVAEGKQKGKQA